MAADNYNTEDLITRLSWRPHYILNSMIRDSKPIQSTVLQTFKPYSTGCLDVLPLEILQRTLNLLDFRSLSRLAHVCHGGRAAVQSLPAYRDLIKYASPALVALNRTELIIFHPAISIYAALHSGNCSSCQNYGPFLFLPTCERCCYECLCSNPSMRVITNGMAKIHFGISPKDLRRIPAMLSVPGTYSVRYTVTRRKRTKLVSLKQARELGVAVHGSEEAMGKFVALRNNGKLTCQQLHVGKWLKASFEKPQSHYQTVSISYANTPNDRFCGMASVVFPSLRQNGVLENGLWCYGCRFKFENYYRTRELDSTTELRLAGAEPIKALMRPEYQARSKSEFIGHVRECKGSEDYLQTLEQDTQ